jgi:hypothetical protein
MPNKDWILKAIHFPEAENAMAMQAKQQDITDRAAAAKQNRTLSDYKTAEQIRGMRQGMRLKERTAQEKAKQNKYAAKKKPTSK